MQYPLYLSILVPLPLKQPIFTYVYEADSIEEPQLVGRLVTVPFGTKKCYTGLVMAQQHTAPEGQHRLKPVLQLLPYPSIPPYIIELWQWASNYYMCSLGEVLTAAIHQSFRPDGTQGEEPRKATLTLRGWLPSERLMSDAHFRGYLEGQLKSGSAAEKALQKILTSYQKGDKPPMSLQDLAEWLETSSYTINKLRKVGAVEECEVLASTLNEGVPLPIHKVGDPLSKLISIGSSRIALVHCPNSRIEERIPYDYLLQEVAKGKQVLLLLPNIEVLKQLLPELQKQFGVRLYRYFSTATEKERRTTWFSALSGEGGLYIGLRAAVWLPFASLGLVAVLDEEDRGYRQYEPAPRFTATHVALMLAHFAKVETLLVSATPSVESYTLALQQKYSFVTSSHTPPEVRLQTVWMPKAFEDNSVQGRMLSFQMIGAIREAIDEGGLALLLYQRKGFARSATCPKCQASPKCPHCHTTLRYMEQSRMLVCGLCGFFQPLPSHCPECGAGGMQLIGTGIERLRRAMEELFPGVAIKMAEEVDRRSKLPSVILSSSYQPPQEYLSKATTIGWVQLDLLYALSDYRANELTFRYLMQSRNEAPMLKRMVVQHFATAPNALTAFEQNDYQQMLDFELEERHSIQLPPFSRHIDIYFESAAQSQAYQLATTAATILQNRLPDATTLGPAPMPVHKKATAIGYKVTLLAPLQLSSLQLREAIHQLIDPLLQEYRGPKMNCYYDVDPL